MLTVPVYWAAGGNATRRIQGAGGSSSAPTGRPDAPPFRPVCGAGSVGDDPGRWGLRIQGVPVLGAIDHGPSVARSRNEIVRLEGLPATHPGQVAPGASQFPPAAP